MTKRIYSALLVILMTVLVAVNGYHHQDAMAVLTDDDGIFQKKDNLEIWYTDEALGDYLARAALQYYQETGVRVVPTYVSGVRYLEQINQAEIDGTNAPDLYIVTNDMLEKAYLSGLAVPIKDERELVNEQHFSKAALSAVTYQNKLLGYPLYFETSLFLYNETYLHDMAVATIEAERNAAEGEAAQEMIDSAESVEELDMTVSADAVSDEPVSEEMILDKELELVPVSMDRILTFAESYDAPENVEAVFKWDVSDIFYNYFIVGDTINIGGENGDDFNQIDIYNQPAVDCLLKYQELNQFFSIDSASVSYDEVLQDFMDGKIVFTVATTDAINRLKQAKEKGEFQYDYAITSIPQVSDELSSRSLSVTNALVINGYSASTDEANRFADYLIDGQEEDFYTLTDKIPAKNDIQYENDAIYAALDEYAISIPMPKMMRTSSFWAQLEIAFTKVWDGEDVDATLLTLDQTVREQIAKTE